MPQLVEAKRAGSLDTLALLDRELAQRPFIAGSDYTIADLSLTLNWRDFELRGAVRNLFDRRVYTFGTFAENPTAPGSPVQRWLTPAPPRHVQVSLSTDF